MVGWKAPETLAGQTPLGGHGPFGVIGVSVPLHTIPAERRHII